MNRSQPRSALREFLATEVAGGVILLAVTAIALVWANSPWSWPGADSYERLWSGDLRLRHWVNDGLMAVFFLVVGLEVKRELVQGELADRRRAILPVVAAAGGMVVPALLYAAVNAGALDGGAPSGGASRWRRTSRSRWASSLSSRPVCPPRCGCSCSRSPSSTTSARSW